MGQDWYIFSMDHGEILYRDTEPDCLVDLLAVPVRSSLMQSSGATKLVYDISEIEPLSNLTFLPDELLLGIFHNLDFVSCFRLSLVSKRLWNFGWPFVRQKVAEFMGPWAGARVICLGEECKPGDLPAGLLTAEEENIVNKGLDDAEIYPDGLFSPGPGNLRDIARCRFREIDTEIKPYRMLYQPVPGEVDEPNFSNGFRPPRTALDEARHLPKAELLQAYLFAHEGNVTDYYPETENWILRNLTTAEFVHGDRLFAAFHRSGRQHGPHLGFPGFGEAIMCRICWSTSDTPLSCARCNRGIWAGHRFEICTEKRHALHTSYSWKDATSEVIDELSVALSLPIRGSKNSKRIEDRKPGS